MLDTLPFEHAPWWPNWPGQKTGQGPCPVCGGTDRFHITSPPKTRKTFAKCRRCEYVWWPNTEDVPVQNWPEVQRQDEREKRDVLLRLQRERPDLIFNRILLVNPEGQAAWRQRRIGEWLWKKWNLGYRPLHERYGPSLTIPFYDPKPPHRLLYLQHRILHPVGEDKYRGHWRKMVPIAWWNGESNGSRVFVTEGAIKAMAVSKVTCHKFPVLGTYGQRFSDGDRYVLDQFRERPIIYIPDPPEDGFQVKLLKANLRELPQGTWVFQKEDKIDDWLNLTNITPRAFMESIDTLFPLTGV